jgi:hypothetical protein
MNSKLREIQDYPLSDSPNNDAFEAIVELYYQIKGYITSSGKWFWVWEKGKRQRGYQDIDVLAVNEKEAVIVSVVAGLKAKVGKNFYKTRCFFERTEEYFKNVSEYNWLVNSKRIKRIIAYEFGFRNKEKKEAVQKQLLKVGIRTLEKKDIVQTINDYLESKRDHLKIQNQILRILQVLNRLEEE